MKQNALQKKLSFIFAIVAIIAVFTVSAYAEIAFEDGKITGLEERGRYEYTYVTIADYNATLEEPDLSKKTFTPITANADGEYTSKLDAGIICIRKEGTSDNSFIWIEGDPLERSDIGTLTNGHLAYQATTSKQPYYWTDGTWVLSSDNVYWMGEDDSNPYLFATPSGDISKNLLTNLRLNPTNETYITQVKNRLTNISYKYAYQSNEIIPVEELYTFTFIKGVREGALNATSPSGEEFQTKVILYTMNEEGKVTAHPWLEATTSHTGNTYNVGKQSKTHTISIPSSFQDANGYIVGIEVFPFAVLPSDVKFSVLYKKGSGDQKDSDGNYNIYMSYSFEYVPSGYTTKHKNNETVVPFQYNGANKAYIEGYGDGTFKPDAKITKAEVSTIIARLINEKIPAGYVSSFKDVVPGSWYYDAIAFLENLGGFEYITDGTFEPNEYITRGELAKILSAFIEMPEKEYANPFGDIDEEYAYYNEIIALAGNNILKGYEDETFRPENTVSRAEAVAMINRFINLIIREETVDFDTASYFFTDISGHWAEADIIVASNDNVKTKAHTLSNSALKETEDTIYFENDYAKIIIAKTNVKVIEIINKVTGLDVSANSLVPFFATAKSKSGLTFLPKYAEIVDGRLHVVFGNGTEAYFIVEEHNTFFTIELDSDIPLSLASISFGRLGIAGTFSNSNPDTYRLSAIPMDTRVANGYQPGGSSKATSGSVSETLRVDAIGAKLGIAFARFGGLENGEHRKALKDITDAINPTKGLTSTAGGAYALDTPLLFEDYVITQQVTVNTLDAAIETAKKYSVEIFDLHHNTNSTFRQGDFIFYASVTDEEKAAGITYTDAATFKERISDKLHENELKLALHTYASGIKAGCTSILSNPYWQKQLVYNDEVYTLAEDIPATTDSCSLKINQSTKNLKYPSPDEGAVPSSTIYTAYFLIDEEIIQIAYQSKEQFVWENEFWIHRAACGTKATEHKAGAEVKQLLGIHQCLQPVPGSELFWHIADLTAKAYNEADFDMIYLDGQEGFARFCKDSENEYYYYAEFTRRVVSQCIKDPTLESSAFRSKNMWAAGGRYGAVDLVTRAIKFHKKGHYTNYGKPTINDYYTGTLGWFGFDTDGSAFYKNTVEKTIFRDDLDYMGSMAIASNLSMALNGFNPTTFTKDITTSKLIENFNYYGVYSRLRKGGYFAPSVKEELLQGEYEYRLIKRSSGYVFEEMKYVDLKVWYDEEDTIYNSTTATNPFNPETPFIRIEQRYSTLGENYIPLLGLDKDETVNVATKSYTISPNLNLTNNKALKVWVHGNGKANGAILISLYSTSAGGRADYFVPTSHTGWREFTLMEVENNDYAGYSFSGIDTLWSTSENYRATISHGSIRRVQITTTGDMTGVMMKEIFACTPVDSPAKNPAVTVNGVTITFKDTVIHSGEYIEYYPIQDKAYLNYYEKTYDANGKWTGNKAHTKQIDFSITGGDFIAPMGTFTYSYSAESAEGNTAPLRAKVHLGLRGKQIANPDDWEVPEIDMGSATLNVIIK